jgi:hypothetical protein
MRRLALPLLVAAVSALAPGAARGADGEARILVPARPVVVVSAELPRTHLFGDRIVAVLELSVNAALVNASRIWVETDFSPYGRHEPLAREHLRGAGRTLVRFRFPLQCVELACLDTLAKPFRFPPARVNYIPRRGDGIETLEVRWPRLAVGSRVTALDLAQPEFRAAAPVRPRVSYGVSPRLLGWSLAGGAALALAGAALLARRLWPKAPIEAPAGRAERLTLEEALRDLARAQVAGVEERRIALDELAHALDDLGLSTLATRTRRLAWSRREPAPEAIADLVEAVREKRAEAAA